MRWAELLAGPFGRDYWLSYNQGARFEVAAKWGVEELPQVLTRGLCLYDPADKADTEFLKKFGLLDSGGKPRPCRVGYDVVNAEFMPKIPLWRLDGVYNIAFTDLVYDGVAQRCTARDLTPAVADVIRLDVDLAPGEKEKFLESVLTKLEKLKIDAAVMDSGGKGFHLWFVPEVPVPARFVPALRRGLAIRLGVEVDPQTVGDLMRCFRMPWTINLKTGRRAKFVHGKPWPKPIPLGELKTLILIGVEVKVAEPRPPPKKTGGVPRWVQRLIDYMCATGELCHYARVAVARSLLAAGWSVDQVVEVFRCAKDFGEKKTRYHVEYEAKRLAAGERPWRCETVLRHCGGDVPEDLCEGLNTQKSDIAVSHEVGNPA